MSYCSSRGEGCNFYPTERGFFFAPLPVFHIVLPVLFWQLLSRSARCLVLLSIREPSFIVHTVSLLIDRVGFRGWGNRGNEFCLPSWQEHWPFAVEICSLGPAFFGGLRAGDILLFLAGYDGLSRYHCYHDAIIWLGVSSFFFAYKCCMIPIIGAVNLRMGVKLFWMLW